MLFSFALLLVGFFLVINYVAMCFRNHYLIAIYRPIASEYYSGLWLFFLSVALGLEYIYYSLLMIVPGHSWFSFGIFVFLFFIYYKYKIIVRLSNRIEKGIKNFDKYPYLLNLGRVTFKDKMLYIFGSMLYLYGLGYLIFSLIP